MADYDVTEKLAGTPKYVWILGGVAVITTYFYWRQRNTPGINSATTDSSLAYGSAGGTGLEASNPMDVPAATGITSPIPVAPTPKPYSETSSTSKPTLRRGATGEAVTTLQETLAAAGLNVPVTGLYDLRTEKAVKAYQVSRGLSADGIAGSQTWAAITVNKPAVEVHKEKPTTAVVKAPKVIRKSTGRKPKEKPTTKTGTVST